MRILPALAVLTVLALAACAPAPIASGITDPHEAQNREVHALNREIDQVVFRPLSRGYGGGVPGPFRQGVANFAANVDLPRSAVNGLLQFRPQDAMHNTLRFVVNTTVGIGGLFDPATAIGLPARDTDFGETLHIWGFGEGNYVELPVIGPSTERDTVGAVVDLALNPLSYVLPKPESYAPTVAQALSNVGDRYTYGTTVDSILYESADSYAQARVLYLENRRYELRRFGGAGAAEEDDYLDPYAEDAPPGAAVPDYEDPYEDLE